MRTPVVTVVFCIFTSLLARAAEPGKADSVEKELARLEGSWEGYAVEGRGENPGRGPVHLSLSITRTNMHAVALNNGSKDLGTGTYTIDPAKAVKELDARGIVLPGKQERTYLGIYSLEGDTLKWCVDNRQKERPTEFQTAAGKFLLILKRKP